MNTIELTTPAISLNNMYRGRRFLTEKGKQTKLSFQWEVKIQWRKEILIVPVALNVYFFFKDNRRRDIDSHLKCLLDSLTGIVYEDDSQIHELHIYKSVDKKNPRTIIEIL